VLGAPPAFKNQVHVGRPNIGNREKLLERINGALDRGWLTNSGPLLIEFQKKLADYLGVEHCICTSNGTVALEIAIRALELSGEVIVPSFTFVATPHSLQWQEITPVFCDIDPATHNIDPERIEALITPRTTAIVGVHLWGRPCNVEALTEIADRHGLKLIFDAAHAFGCSHEGKKIGGFGTAEVFSFHATKFFNTLEGGAIATNDEELARRTRLMKNFGFTFYDQVEHIGTNGKMNEVSAAMGLTGLDSLEAFIDANRLCYQRYRKELSGIPGIRVIEYDEREEQNFQYVVLEVDAARTGIRRDELMATLHAENVLARRYFYPGCHAMEPYKSYFPNAKLLLPKTMEICDRVLILPTGGNLGEDGIQVIASIIRLVIERSGELRERKVDMSNLRLTKYGETELLRRP
jgi:dTDP-4-amino-4,6-dideoxygalactose transaminase